MKKELTFLSKGYERVFITTDGDIISHRQGKPKTLSQYKDEKGYCYIKLWNTLENKARHLSIHRLVGKAFIPNPNSYPEIDHLNRDKGDNRADNLEWVTRKENVRRSDNPIRNNTPCRLLKGDEVIGKFDSKAQACRYASDTFGIGYYYILKFGKSGDFIVKV